MSFDYAALAQEAHEILAEFGAAGTLTRKDRSGAYDPALGMVPETTTTQDIVGLVLPVDAELVNGSTVQVSDEMAYISAVGLSEPKAADILSLNGNTYTVTGVRWTAPAGVGVLGQLFVRR
jgi:hypothetical protein